MAKQRVGVLFGSRSVEHDVSIVTGRQVIAALDRTKYDVVPIYITEEGRWLSGDSLATLPLATFKRDAPNAADVAEIALRPDPSRGDLTPKEAKGLFGFGGGRARSVPAIDIAFPCVHGTYGEDGTLQGLFELANLPYVGAGVVGSAVGMDKIMMKAAFTAAGIPNTRYRWFTAARWQHESAAVLKELEEALGYPMFVKPANLGSSVGISRATDINELEYAIEVAIRYDRRILVEEGLDGIIEINCSVVGNDDLSTSVCEQPARWQEFLSYEDKYLSGGKTKGMSGQKRQIPAPIGDELTANVQQLCMAAFRAVDCAGIARVDSMVNLDDGRIWVNEINTMPGSLAFYLWEPAGVPFPALCDRLLELGFARHRDKADRVTRFDNALLQQQGAPKASRPGA